MERIALKVHQEFLQVTFFSLCSVILLDFITTFNTVDHFLTPLLKLRGLPDQHQPTGLSCSCFSFMFILSKL